MTPRQKRISRKLRRYRDPFYIEKRKFDIVRRGVFLQKWAVSTFKKTSSFGGCVTGLSDEIVSPYFDSYVGAIRWILSHADRHHAIKKGRKIVTQYHHKGRHV
jgi:hypothetical protein